MERVVGWSLALYLGFILWIAVGIHGKSLFWDWHGWRHRLSGGMLLLWLFLGSCFFSSSSSSSSSSSTLPLYPISDSINRNQQSDAHRCVYCCANYFFCLAYDVILGVLGIAATLTAARDFPHKHVQNESGQSGTLASKAIVTQAEMIEHSFYQGLNLWQALYLHAMASMSVAMGRRTAGTVWAILFCGGALWLVTAPWHWRRRFPVHSFSNNWKLKHEQQQQRNKSAKVNSKIDEKKQPPPSSTSSRQESIMYKIKKWQYIFYKHVIFHGLNISIALRQVRRLTRKPQQEEQQQQQQQQQQYHHETMVYTRGWRLFWIALNAAYVLELFLQSLVKRKIVSQAQMLLLNQCLMLISSLAAATQSTFRCLIVDHWHICLASAVLNFTHRHCDVMNTVLIFVVVFLSGELIMQQKPSVTNLDRKSGLSWKQRNSKNATPASFLIPMI
ncbi:hypothetical protein ACA910_006011 [Epithemia clementina (nom. ined.)]